MNTIKRIHIQNFRSIVNSTIELSDLNIFVGKNDAGKSNVLKALDMFFNDSKGEKYGFDENYSLYSGTDEQGAKEIRIDLTVDMPSRFGYDNPIVWSKIWREDGVVSEGFDRAMEKKSDERGFLDGIRYEYVPAIRDRDYFRCLLDKLFVSLSSSDPELSDAITNYIETVKNSTEKFNAEIGKNIGIESSLHIPSGAEINLKGMQVQTTESSMDIPLQMRGDGVQARYVPSILKFIRDKSIVGRDSSDVVTVWGYEEPENGIEMEACLDFAKEFLGYSSEIQELITTHSPMFYDLDNGNGEKSVLYHVCRKDGISTFERKKSDDEELNGEMGVLALVEPYLLEVKSKLTELEEERDNAWAELERVKSGAKKILIYTEGITDRMYIEKDLEASPDLKKICMFHEYGHAARSEENSNDGGGGFGMLDNLYKYLQESEDNVIKIFIYDRDGEIFDEPVEKGRNHVYRFNIPVPNIRRSEDRISIEHYFTDDEIKTFDDEHRRLFMAGEFNDSGCDDTGTYRCDAVRTSRNRPSFNGLRIIDGSGNRKVSTTDKWNVALPKIDFARYVTEGNPKFDFGVSRFDPIIEVIRDIKNDEKI